MSDLAPQETIRRILVALDASRQSRLALDAAAKLAEWHDAELQGLYVEDINLIRLASLSVSREIGTVAASPDPIDTRRLARRLSLSAAEAERWLAETASQRNIRWTFRVERGDVTSAIEEAASDADIVALGRAGTGTSGPGRLGSTARALVFQQSRSVIVIQGPLASGGTVVTVFDDSAISARAVTISARLCERLKTRLVVLVLGGDDGDTAHTSQLFKDADALVKQLDLPVVVKFVKSAQDAVTRAIQAENPALCVLACRPESTELVRRLTDQLRMSVFLVK